MCSKRASNEPLRFRPFLFSLVLLFLCFSPLRSAGARREDRFSQMSDDGGGPSYRTSVPTPLHGFELTRYSGSRKPPGYASTSRINLSEAGAKTAFC